MDFLSGCNSGAVLQLVKDVDNKSLYIAPVYSFAAPLVKPDIKYLRRKMKMIVTGIDAVGAFMSEKEAVTATVLLSASSRSGLPHI